MKKTKYKYAILVHNDDYNEHDYVATVLADVCDLNWLQAVQCTELIHNKKQYIVKYGSKEYCRDTIMVLDEAGLNAELITIGS